MHDREVKKIKGEKGQFFSNLITTMTSLVETRGETSHRLGQVVFYDSMILSTAWTYNKKTIPPLRSQQSQGMDTQASDCQINEGGDESTQVCALTQLKKTVN